MNVQLLAAVAIGGSLGSVARYLVAIGAGRLVGTEFPWGTLVINIVGSFLIGVFAESFALSWNASQAMRVFLTVGICGGFTTFSTFSLDAIVLMQRGECGRPAPTSQPPSRSRFSRCSAVCCWCGRSRLDGQLSGRFSVILRSAERASRRMHGPASGRRPFEARPAAQLRRKARTFSDKGEAFARG